MMKIQTYEEYINENFLDNLQDYYKIFGFKNLLIDKILSNDSSNITYKPHNYGKILLKRSDVVPIIKQVVDFYYHNKDVKFLGNGYFGSVYQTSDETKVLKITSDYMEIGKVERFKKIKTDCIVDYYDVREIIIHKDGQKLKDTWAIILEKVEPLNNFEKSVWRSISEKLNYAITPVTSKYKYKNNKFFDDDGQIDKNLPEKLYNTCVKMVELIDRTINLSSKYETAFDDLHEKNLGKSKNGDYKFFDVRSDRTWDENENLILSSKPIDVYL